MEPGPDAARAWPGWLLAAMVTAVAVALEAVPYPPFRIETEEGVRQPLSAAIIAMILGMVVANLRPLPGSISLGSRAIIRRVIPIAIVLIGAGLNLAIIREIGGPALLIILFGIVLTLAAAHLTARLCQLTGRTGLLLGVGTAICGSTAIVTIAPILKADDDELIHSIGTVNLHGLLIMLALPALGGWLAMSPEAYGIWAGVSVHAVPQAVAAGFAFTNGSGELATLVKLVRVAMLAPLVLLVAMVAAASARRAAANSADGSPVPSPSVFALIPWFIWGFFAMAVVRTVLPAGAADTGSWGAMGSGVLDSLSSAGGLLLVLSMAAIGLEVRLRHLFSVGIRAIVVGGVATVILAVGTFGLIGALIPPR